MIVAMGGWKKQLQETITSASELAAYRELSREEKVRMDAILAKYPMRVTRYYLSLVDWAIALIPGMQEFVWTSVPFAWCKPVLVMVLSLLLAVGIRAAKQHGLEKKNQ